MSMQRDQHRRQRSALMPFVHRSPCPLPNGRRMFANNKITTKPVRAPVCVLVLLLVVVVVLTCDLTHVFLHMNQWMHRIGAAEHLGDRLPASPPPPSPRQPTVVGHRGLKNGHSRPAGRSAKHAAKCGKNSPLQIIQPTSWN